MRTDGFFDSCGEGKIHYFKWEPEGQPKGVVQIIHGMAEMAERYDAFARYLNSQGYVVAAEDHMGHGQSVESVPCYFKGGWMNVVRDCMSLTDLMKQEYPELPMVILGHSMGSFLLRTILCKYPDIPVEGAIVVGTGWHTMAELRIAAAVTDAVVKKNGEKYHSTLLDKLYTGNYNQKVEHKKTEFDWLCRDQAVVDAYVDHPSCGAPITAGMYRDINFGVRLVENPENLKNMKPERPVLFLAGKMDPVGSYGKGVMKTVEAFREAGVRDVQVRIYPLDRHEILNEINKEEVWGHVAQWLQEKLF